MVKRFFLLFVLFSPGIFLLYLYLNPAADQVFRAPTAHFYVVTFTTFTAVVISILLVAIMGRDASPRYAIATVAFAAMGLFFFSHGLATPGALSTNVHPAIGWGAWLTLFIGGVLFTIAGMDGVRGHPHWLSVPLIVRGTFVFVIVYYLMALFSPEILSQLEENANPALRLTIFYISLVLWCVAAVLLWITWRKNQQRLDAMLVFVAVWLAIATISMHQFPTFQYSWWIYHINLLGAFLLLVVTLLIEFEQLREFRLLPYFLALSFILTAFFALVGSYFTDQFTQRLLLDNAVATTAEISIRARRDGLLIVGGSMSLLMLGLLTVVWRADRILSNQTLELRQLSTQLQTYSEWLLGPDLLQRLLKDPNALSLVRRERTVLFMDIRGFTSWSEAHSPEKVVELLNEYYVTIENVLKEANIVKFKFAADEAMVVIPDASTASCEAVELRDKINQQLEKHSLGVGIGLHTGPLVEGLLGSMGVKFFDVIGDTVNTAKRIESAALKGEVLVSEVTFAALENTVRVGEARSIFVKGKDTPVTVYRVLGPVQ